MKQKRQQQSEAAQQQSKLATQSAISKQNAEQKSQLQQEATDQRIKERLTVGAVLNSAKSEADEGAPDESGIEGAEPDVE